MNARRCAVLVCAALLLTSCGGDDPDATPAERTAAASAPTVANDLARNSAHRTLKIPGEAFVLTVDYYLTAYDATRWRTLAAKTVNVSVHVRPTGKGAVPQVLLGAFDARASLRAVDPGLDGLPVATMADRPPAALAGYAMTTSYPYDAVVPVDGFSPALVERWSYLAGDQALTEQGLAKAGVYANSLTFDYSLLIRSAGDPAFHKRSVTDTLTVPVTA